MSNEIAERVIPFLQEGVRKKFAGAILRTDGFMYWVENGPTAASVVAIEKEIIGRRASTPGRAWRSALEFAAAR